MAHNNSDQAARSSREMKAVASVVTLLALPIIGFAFFFDTWDARAVCLYVGAAILAIAAGLWVYALRPSVFGASSVVGDPLRTVYRTPERTALVAHTGTAEATPSLSNARRLFPVSEHIYGWQSVRRVAAGERIWDAAYVRLVTVQTAVLLAAIVVNGLLAVGITFGLAACDGAAFFLAGAAVLAVGFQLGIATVIADGEQHPTKPMAALPDVRQLSAVVERDRAIVGARVQERHAA